MADIFLKRTMGGTLAPADEHAENYIRLLKFGFVVRATVKIPRNYQHHKLIMALLTLTYRTLPEQYEPLWPSFDKFRKAVAYEVGHRDETTLKDGTIIEGPGSLSYDALDEAAFTRVSGAMMTWCANLLDMHEPELAAEVSRYADESYGVTT